MANNEIDDYLAGLDELHGFSASKGALKLPVDTPPPAGLVRTLIRLRRAEAGV